MCAIYLSHLIAFALSLSLPLMASNSFAQNFPSKPIQLVSPFAAGGTSDVVARATSKLLESELGHAVVVVNRAGAGGTIGIASVANAPPDGYTLVVGGLGSVVFPTVMYRGKIKYDARRDLIALAGIASAPTVIAVRSNLPVKNLPELIALAQAQPNKLSFASAGVGGTLHVAGVLLERETGIQLNHVPYKGGAPALTDLAAGAVDIALADVTLVKPLLAGGRIRIIAIASAQRSALLLDVPTTTEVGYPGIRLDTWYALFAPTGTSNSTLTTLRNAVEKIKSNPQLASTLHAQGLVPMQLNAAQFSDVLEKDFEKWPPLLERICSQSACQ